MEIMKCVSLFTYVFNFVLGFRFVEESAEIFDSASSDPASDFNVQM